MSDPENLWVVASCAQVASVVVEEPSVASDDDAVRTAHSRQHPQTIEHTDEVRAGRELVAYIGVGGLAEGPDVLDSAGPERGPGKHAVLLEVRQRDPERGNERSAHQDDDGPDQEAPMEA